MNDEEVFTILNENHDFYLTLNARKTFHGKTRAAIVIQRAWRAHRNRRIYRFLRNKLVEFTQEDPVRMLRRVSVFEAEVFEKKYGHRLVFRLAGPEFPPVVMYKIFIGTRRHVSSGDAKTPLKIFNRGEWKVFYVYKKTHESVLTAKRRRYKKSAASKRKKSEISWIKTMY